jgi:hypothetical protein
MAFDHFIRTDRRPNATLRITDPTIPQARLDSLKYLGVSLGLRNSAMRARPRPVTHHHADEIQFSIGKWDANLNCHSYGGWSFRATLARSHLVRLVAPKPFTVIVRAFENHPVLVGHSKIGARSLIFHPRF